MASNKVLVPVDGSSHSHRAAEYAIHIARKLDMGILVIYCHKPYPVLLGKPYYQQALNKISDQANEVMTPFEDMLRKVEMPYTGIGPEGRF